MPRSILLQLLFILSGVIIPGLLSGADQAGQWPMGWRTYASIEQGIAVRFPYEWHPFDQYEGLLLSGSRWFKTGEGRILDVGPDDKPAPLPLVIFSEPAGARTVREVAEAQAREVLTWGSSDYYAVTPQRPHAQAGWAPKGINAQLGIGATCCALVAAHADRISGVVLRGRPDSGDNARIIASFEVLKPDPRGRTAAPGQTVRGMTWRESQWAAGRVVGRDGAALPAGSGARPVLWSQAWEIETEHYHVTGNTSPARLVQHGYYLEALFRAYSRVYLPQRMPPYKFEVHVFDTRQQFQQASASWGHEEPPGNQGIRGGFFAPDQLSLWVFEESGRLGGADFSVEHVMAHECSHQFLYVATNGNRHVPTWLNEGLAVYFEAGRFNGGDFIIQTPIERLGRLKQAYAQNGREGTTLRPLDWYLGHEDGIDAAEYAEVYAMTHFWIFGDCDPASCPGARRKDHHCGLMRFREYWQELKNDADGREAFNRLFLADMVKNFGSRERAIAEWTKALRQHVLTRMR